MSSRTETTSEKANKKDASPTMSCEEGRSFPEGETGNRKEEESSQNYRGPSYSVSWVPAAVCLILNLIIFATIAINNPDYLRDYRQNVFSDARHYVLLGRNFFLLGEYSRCGSEPYVPDYLRTPVYPLFAGGLDILGGAVAIYLAQIGLHVVSCLVLFRLVKIYFGNHAAFWASLLFATDLMLVISNFEAMAEPLFSALILGSAACLIPTIIPPSGSSPQLKNLVAGGILLALATLARPAGLYLVVVYILLLLGTGIASRRWVRSLRWSVILAMIVLVSVGAWIARNVLVFSTARLTHADAVMLVYFAGAGAYQIEHNMDLQEAQEKIREEFSIEPPEVTNNHWRTDKPIAKIDAELRKAIVPVLTKYPIALVKSSLLGMIKATFSHNLPQLCPILGIQWTPPGTGSLLSGDPDAFERLNENGMGMVLVFWGQVTHNALTWIMATLGLILTLRKSALRPFGLCLLVILLYFYLTVAVVGLEAFYRSRTPHMPYLFAFAGLGIAGILRWRRFPSPERSIPSTK